eukprot:767959-Hanusia_phi.AAC.3
MKEAMEGSKERKSHAYPRPSMCAAPGIWSELRHFWSGYDAKTLSLAGKGEQLEATQTWLGTEMMALGRQAGRQAGRWAGRQAGRQAGRWAGRQAERPRQRTRSC